MRKATLTDKPCNVFSFAGKGSYGELDLGDWKVRLGTPKGKSYYEVTTLFFQKLGRKLLPLFCYISSE